jgi:uncharacterized protein (TIGR03435 family)
LTPHSHCWTSQSWHPAFPCTQDAGGGSEAWSLKARKAAQERARPDYRDRVTALLQSSDRRTLWRYELKSFLASIAFFALLGVVTAADDAAKEASPVFQIVIKPSQDDVYGSGAGVYRPNQLGKVYSSTRRGMTVKSIVQSTAEVRKSRLFIEATLPEGKFDVIAQIPNDRRRALDPMVRQAVEATFNLSSRHEKRDLEAYVLTVKSTDAKGLKPTAKPKEDFMQAGRGYLSCTNVTMDSFAGNLETLLKKPVIDETGLKDGYDVDFRFDQDFLMPPEPDALIAAAADQLGLQLILATRPMDVVVISNQSSASEKTSKAPAK